MASMQEDVAKALNRSYFYLKFRPRTEREVRDYLAKKSEKFYHWQPEVIDQAIEELKNQDLINDYKFVEAFVSSRTAIKPKGEFALRQELMKYRIAKNIVDDFFAEEPVAEEESARRALTLRWSRYRGMDKRTRFEKAVQFLLRRGFSFSTAKKTIAELEGEE